MAEGHERKGWETGSGILMPRPIPTHPEKAPVGGLILAEGDIELNAGRPTVTLKVRNTGDRPIQVGSHFHFFETNRYLDFDRPATFGMRLDIPSTTAIRFEPGDEKEVTLVPIDGKQFCHGFNNLVDGWTGDGPTPDYRPNYEAAVKRAKRAWLQVQQVLTGRNASDVEDFTQAVCRPLRADRRATRSASATRTCMSRSRRTCATSATSWFTAAARRSATAWARTTS